MLDNRRPRHKYAHNDPEPPSGVLPIYVAAVCFTAACLVWALF